VTLYTLPDSPAKIKMRRYALIYLCIALFCGLFSAVYEYFSHGVFADFMVYLFAFPLIGGVLPYAVLGFLRRAACPPLTLARVYNSGIAALTAGSCVQGILDIYGTSSVYIPVYWILGGVLVLIPLALYLVRAVVNQGRRAGI